MMHKCVCLWPYKDSKTTKQLQYDGYTFLTILEVLDVFEDETSGGKMNYAYVWENEEGEREIIQPYLCLNERLQGRGD